VIVTHNAALAAGMPRVVTLRDGRVEKDEIRESAGYREFATTTERAGTGKVDVG
jgi:ABC-type lipoprotein export system ATPase subunit